MENSTNDRFAPKAVIPEPLWSRNGRSRAPSGVQANQSISGPGAAFRRPLATAQRPFVHERNGHRSFIDRPVEVGEQPMIATPDGRARPDTSPRPISAVLHDRASALAQRPRRFLSRHRGKELEIVEWVSGF